MSKAAPDLETLFDVETAVETAWEAVLGKHGMRAYPQRSPKDLVVPLVNLKCSLGATTGHRGPDRRGQFWLDAWFFRLDAEVVTVRDAAGPDSHRHMRARVRIIAQYATDSFTEALMPFHVLTARQEAGTIPSIETGDDTDVSIIQIAGTVCIRDTAWPEL
jgi:hypothetical protein